MSRRNVVAIGIVGLLVIGGLALAQQERPTIVRRTICHYAGPQQQDLGTAYLG